MGYIGASCESVLRTGTHPDEKEFAEFLSNAKEKSTFSSEVEITENDTLITLTCPIWNLSAMRSVKPLKSMAAWIFW